MLQFSRVRIGVVIAVCLLVVLGWTAYSGFFAPVVVGEVDVVSASAPPGTDDGQSEHEPTLDVPRVTDPVRGASGRGERGEHTTLPNVDPEPLRVIQAEAGDDRVVYPATPEGIAESQREATPHVHECLLAWAGDVSSFEARIDYSFVIDVSEDDPAVAHPRDVELVTEPMPDVVLACLTSVMADQYFEPPVDGPVVVDDRMLVSLEL